LEVNALQDADVAFDSRLTSTELVVATNALDIEALQDDVSNNSAAIGVNAGNIATNAGNIATNTADIAGLSGSAVPASRTFTAGAGLTGGGDLSANRTFNVGSGTGISVAADSVSLNLTYTDGRYAASSHVHSASDVTSGTFADARIPSLSTSKITSGTFANARISQSSVTQHQAAINAGQVDGKSIAVVASLPGSPDANTIYFVTS
jgi:hypothetical protein